MGEIIYSALYALRFSLCIDSRTHVRMTKELLKFVHIFLTNISHQKYNNSNKMEKKIERKGEEKRRRKKEKKGKEKEKENEKKKRIK